MVKTTYFQYMFLVFYSVDHTYGNPYGHYQYIYVREDQDGDTGLLKSPEVRTTTPDGDCFQFWFYLYSLT